MFRTLSKYLGRLLLLLNALLAIGLLASSNCGYIDPRQFPALSCLGLVFLPFAVVNICFLLFWVIVKPKYAVWPLLTLLLCYKGFVTYIPFHVGDKDIPDDAIKVLSFNSMQLAYLPHTKGNPNPMLQYIKDANADIVCLQEFACPPKTTLPNVDKWLKAYPYRHHEEDLTCYSKYPILSSERIDYVSKGNKSVAYRLKIDQDTVLLVNNHLESNKLTDSDKELYKDLVKNPSKEYVSMGFHRLIGKFGEASAIRAAQADAVHNYIRGSGCSSVIVCGDFNDCPLSYACHTIGKGLTNVYSAKASGLGVSYHEKGFYFRIDHLFVSHDWKVSRCWVDNSMKESDHYPILCYINKVITDK